MKNVVKRVISISMVIVLMLSIAVMFSGCRDLFLHYSGYYYLNPVSVGNSSQEFEKIVIYRGFFSNHNIKACIDVDTSDSSIESECAYFKYNTNSTETLSATGYCANFFGSGISGITKVTYKISRANNYKIGEFGSVLNVTVTYYIELGGESETLTYYTTTEPY